MSDQMIRQWLAAVLARLLILIRFSGRFGLVRSGFTDLFVFRKGEIELVQPLGLGTKPMPVVTMELVLKLFNLER